MSVNSILSAGVQGVQSGLSRLDKAGRQIATAETENVITPIIDMKLAEAQVKSSVAVIKAGDQMLGTLIDIKA